GSIAQSRHAVLPHGRKKPLWNRAAWQISERLFPYTNRIDIQERKIETAPCAPDAVSERRFRSGAMRSAPAKKCDAGMIHTARYEIFEKGMS
ncbi:hypothetical protein, partial [Ruminococcus sp.]|uniref:hypothetical protein n=1 Tax=Ruminococcus sp. TaxID=41978 RepID=UPI00307BC717